MVRTHACGLSAAARAAATAPAVAGTAALLMGMLPGIDLPSASLWLAVTGLGTSGRPCSVMKYVCPLLTYVSESSSILWLMLGDACRT